MNVTVDWQISWNFYSFGILCQFLYAPNIDNNIVIYIVISKMLLFTLSNTVIIKNVDGGIRVFFGGCFVAVCEATFLPKMIT